MFFRRGHVRQSEERENIARLRDRLTFDRFHVGFEDLHVLFGCLLVLQASSLRHRNRSRSDYLDLTGGTKKEDGEMRVEKELERFQRWITGDDMCWNMFRPVPKELQSMTLVETFEHVILEAEKIDHQRSDRAGLTRVARDFVRSASCSEWPFFAA